MKVDFSKVVVKDIEDKDVIVDVSHELGKTMYANAFPDEELQIGKDIYFKKEIELNRPRAEAIKKYLPNFTAVVRMAISQILEKVIESDSIENAKPKK